MARLLHCIRLIYPLSLALDGLIVGQERDPELRMRLQQRAELAQ